MKHLRHHVIAMRTVPRLIPQLKYRLSGICGLLLLALLSCLLFGLLAFNQQEELGRQSDWLHQEVDNLFTGMINEETGVRGYLVTGDSVFLEPFHLGERQYRTSFLSLQRHFQQDGRLQREQLALAHVNEQARGWYRTFALPQIHLMQTGHSTGGRPDQTAKQGKRLFDAFRQAVRQLQVVLDADLQLASRTTIPFPIGNVFFCVALFAIGIYALFCWMVIAFCRDLQSQFDLLRHTARQLEAQDLSARIDPLKHEELNLLGQTFNSMAQALQERQQQLDQTLEELAGHSRQLERAYSESRAILDATNEAMLLLAPDGQVLSINQRFREFFSQPPNDLIHQPFDTLCSWWLPLVTTPDSVLHWLKQKLVDHEPSSLPILFQAVQASRELTAYSTPVLSTTKHYLGQLYVMHDVTYEHELERAKRDFVAQVSHELRTPLTSIKGFVDFLLEKPAELSAEQQEFLQIVQENVQRQIALVNDLLDLSRIESGKMELESTPISLNPLIHSVLQSFVPQVSSKHQQIEVHLVEPSPTVFADPKRVQQILSNLVSNAYKYTLQGGTIRLTTQVHDQEVEVAIQDNGIGMTPEEQAKLFTKFFRAKNRLTEDVGGTGLGLAITHSLVNLHGGVINVESEPGHGSTFRFTLPLAAVASQRAFVPSSSGKKRLLIVDDDPDIAYLFQCICEQHGYETLIATRGQEALQLATQQQPDLIILDLLLPDQHGFAVLEQLKSGPYTARIPVLLVSIFDGKGKGRFLGMVDYLPKPFHKQELLVHIHDLLSDGPASILLLVSDPHTQEISALSKCLQQKGYPLIIATDGTQIVSLVLHHRPALLLLDSNLAPTGGLMALQALRMRQERTLNELPILVLGMQEGALSEQWTTVEQMGGIEIIGQPCQVEDVVEAVTRRLAIGVL